MDEYLVFIFTYSTFITSVSLMDTPELWTDPEAVPNAPQSGMNNERKALIDLLFN